ALQAALQVEHRHPDSSVEVIDLRSLAPYDWEAIKTSVEKTNRVLLAHEDTRLNWRPASPANYSDLSMPPWAGSQHSIRLSVTTRCWSTRSCRRPRTWFTKRNDY